MPRLLFEKVGNSVWISHLDLMRLFQRAFKRSGLLLSHTQGFNPRPSVSIALPLSVGIESECELLDFDLDGQTVSNEEIKERLNRALVKGIRVLDVYDDGKKIGKLAFMDCAVRLEYDRGVPEGAVEKITELFGRDEIIVDKKSKNGPTAQNIAPMIKSLSVMKQDDQTVLLQGRICCQNPTMNPAAFAAAIAKYLPDFAADYCVCRRLRLYDNEEKPFR